MFWTLLAWASLACGPRSVRVVMNAENNSGQSGSALVTDRGAKTRIEVVIGKSDDPRGQPGHVHEGRCGEIGTAKAALSPASATSADPAHFRSDTEVDLSLEALLRGPYALNFHDVRDFSLYVSCGDIVAP